MLIPTVRHAAGVDANAYPSTNGSACQLTLFADAPAMAPASDALPVGCHAAVRQGPPESVARARDAVVAGLIGDTRHAFRAHEVAALSERVSWIRRLYEEPDDRPWIVGFSGGKDSTATTLLVWVALLAVPPNERVRPVHIISTDTGVENPVVAALNQDTLTRLAAAARAQELPIQVHQLAPDPTDSYLVNMLGRGYCAPRQDFRWCTPRLKVAPGNEAITQITGPGGGSVLFLGTRRDESSARRATMDSAARTRTRSFISPNVALAMPGAEVASPIEDWTQEGVWNALLGWNCGASLPWGSSALTIQRIYEEASAQGECGFTVDERSGCGKSGRFGCFTCTVVEEDRTLAALVRGPHPELQPLLELRNELADLEREKIPVRRGPDGAPIAWVDLPGSRGYPRQADEPEGPRRDVRRKRHLPNGTTTWSVDIEDHRRELTSEGTPAGFHILGSYTKPWCEYLLRRFLTVERDLRRTAQKHLAAPDLVSAERGWWEHLAGFTILPDAQLTEIRRLWVAERFWFDDRLPAVVAQVRDGSPPAVWIPTSLLLAQTRERRSGM